MALPSERECDFLRRFEPLDSHEHALLAQLPEFYSDSPSRERLRSIAQRVVRSTEAENRALGRAVVAGLCPTAPDQALAWTLVLAIIALMCWLITRNKKMIK